MTAEEKQFHDAGGAETIEGLDERIMTMAREAPPFYKNPNLLTLYPLMIPGCIVPAVTLGFDSGMMNGLQSVPAWQEFFEYPTGSTLGILNATLALGAIAGTPLISLVCDRYGRRMGIFFGACIMTVGGVLQGASINVGMFIASRTIIGFGMIFANACAPVMIGELSHPKDRQVTTSLYQTSWYLGAIMAAWTTFGTFRLDNDWAWRIPSYLQSVWAIIQVASIWFLPESPRFLIAKGRGDEAKAVLVRYHGYGDEDSLFVKLEFMQMRAVIEAEVSQMVGWSTLIKTPGNRRRLLVVVLLGLFSQWSGNGLVGYYLASVLRTVGITDLETQNILNGCLMVFNWITAVASAFATNWVKRRTQFMISGAGMFTVSATQTLCAGLFNVDGNKAAGVGLVAMLFVYYIFFNFAFNALVYSYPVEVLPYPIRAKGFAVLMFFGKATNFLNTFVNPIGLDAISWKYYGVYVGWLAVECFLIWKFFVETQGHSLEAVAAQFDGDKMAVNLVRLEESEAVEWIDQSIKEKV